MVQRASGSRSGPTSARPQPGTQVATAEPAAESRTRDRVARLLLEQGPATAAGLSETLGLSAAAVRRHLEGLQSSGTVLEREPRPLPGRGRGRPAKVYALTDTGREGFPHAYDDLAVQALRFLRSTGGDDAVAAFAAARVAGLAARLRIAASPHAGDLPGRAAAVAETLTADGYAASSSRGPLGVQLCQHHCPVVHVAAEFPQLCEAETRAIAGALGTHVQRLATIAHGDGVCTTHVPAPPPGTSHRGATQSGTTQSSTRTATEHDPSRTTPRPGRTTS